MDSFFGLVALFFLSFFYYLKKFFLNNYFLFLIHIPVFLVVVMKLLKVLGLCITLGQNPPKSIGENLDLVSCPGGSFSEAAKFQQHSLCSYHLGFSLFHDSVPVVKKNSIYCFQLHYTQYSLNTPSLLTLLVTKYVGEGTHQLPGGGVRSHGLRAQSPKTAPLPYHTLFRRQSKVQVVTCASDRLAVNRFPRPLLLINGVN